MDFATTCARMFLGKTCESWTDSLHVKSQDNSYRLHFTIILCRVKPKVSGFIGLAYRGKDIVFRFIIEYSRSRDYRSIFIRGFLKGFLRIILACVET
jgi:hypothetical protein